MWPTKADGADREQLDDRGVAMREMWRGLRAHPVAGHVLRFRPFALLVAVLIVLSTATATADAPTPEVVYGKLKAQDVRLSIPGTNSPKGIAIWFHGQNGGVDNRMDEPWLQGLVRDGWIVASSDFHTASWGNPVSTEDTKLLKAWAEEQTGHEVRLFVSGSMGATVSLNAMLHGVEPPACWYGVKPAVDPTRMGNVPGAKRIISEAYGGEPVPEDRNPARNVDRFSTETTYRFVASKSDPWVIYDENAGKLSAALEERGADTSLLEVFGPHDDPSHFNVDDLVEFSRGCAKPAS
jgi:hypothetical protein